MLKNGNRNGKILKLLVEISLVKPLLRGSRVKMKNELYWVDFKYEQLPVYVFIGIVGHQERSCTLKLNEAKGKRKYMKDNMEIG